MPLGLRLNTALLSPLRNLSKSVEDGASARERLSSGLRINKASDDAAGLAVANSVDIDRRVYAQGLRNVNDGISYLNVAEGAVTEMGNIVTRLKELTSQGSSTTISSAQRDAINGEVNALSQEYNRILRYASFNDIDLLSDSNSSLTIGTGYSGANINLDLSVGRATLEANRELGGSGLASGDTIWPSALSYDGRYVGFYTVSGTLVGGDVNGHTDFFIQDMETGAVELVSQSTAGVQGNGTSSEGVISDDGRFVAFYGNVGNNNLVVGDVNGVADIYLRDRTLDTTTLVSVSTGSVQANQASEDASISGDGRYVVFTSTATNLVAGDSNGVSDIFLRDTVAGTTTLVSKSSAGTIGNAASVNGEISSDGRYVVYMSDANNLVSGDANGSGDIFKYEIATGTTTRVSLTAEDAEVVGVVNFASISADGRYVSFSATGSFTSDSTGGYVNVFRKDTETGEVVLVSKNVSGSSPNGDSNFSKLSADGQFIAYRTAATNIVAGDTNGFTDVVVTDIQSGITRFVSASDSGVQGDGDSGVGEAPLISGDGQKIAFITSANNLISGGTLGGAQAGIYATNPLFRDNVVNLMAGISVATAGQASSSLDRLDEYENEVVNLISVIGAASSRLSYASSNLSSTEISLDDAYSRIMDADIAAEATRVVQADLRTQSGLVAVQQAGKLSQLALDLLQNSFGD